MAAHFDVLSDAGFLTGMLDDYPAPTQEMLRRAATLRSFGRELYDRVLTVDLPEGKAPPMSWEKLIRQSFVEPLPGREPCYRLKESVRLAFIATWDIRLEETTAGGPSDIPEGLRKLSRALADYYDRPGAELDRLYHLVACDRDEALRLFVSQFDAADADFDLPRCHALIQVLKERERNLGPALADAFQRREGRLAARSRWALEYYATVDYYRRASLEGMLESLFANDEKWVLHLVAPGGLGKTTYLRWVIARRCLPEDIPVAHIDFDFVLHMTDVVGEPWRLLLHIARQLDDQLPGRPYRSLVESNLQYIAQADNQNLREQPPVPLDAAQLGVKEEEVFQKFTGLLFEARRDGPVLLILDTLENLNNRRVDLAALFMLVNRVQTRLRELGYRGLRVLLSGRINLATMKDEGGAAVNDFQAAFRGKNEVKEITPFTDDEARAYLLTIRRLPDDDRIAAIDDRIAAIIEKAEANPREPNAKTGASPLKLKLLADLVKDRPDFTADEIRQYAGADLAGLIDRVIDRLHDPQLRWLIRYGVTPTLLTLDFANKVIAPYLPEPAAKGSTLDNPEVDELPDAVLARQPFSPPTAEDLLAVEKLWDRLREYTAEASWIHTSPDDPDALSFPPHVREPMRYLLRRQKVRGYDILLRLHKDAFNYFKEKAAQESDPARRALWLAETVYHRYQIGDARAADYWRKQMAAASEPKIATRLALEVLKQPEQIFEGETRSDALPWYGDDVRGPANLELARLRLAEEPYTSTSVMDAETYLRAAERIAAEKGFALPPAVLAYVRGTVLLARGKVQEASDAGHEGLAQVARNTAAEVELLTLVAQASDALGQSPAPKFWDRALRAARAAPPAQQVRLRRKLVRWMWRIEDYERELAVLDEIQGESRSTEEAYAAYIAAIHTYVAMGQENCAITTGDEVRHKLLNTMNLSDGRPLSSVAPLTDLVQVELELARLSYAAMPADLAARAPGPTENGAVPFLTDAGVRPMDAADNHFARMRALVCDIPRATQLLEEQARFESGTPEQAKRYLKCAQLYMDEVGDYRGARSDLGKARAALTSRDTLTAFRIDMLDALLEAKRFGAVGNVAPTSGVGPAANIGPVTETGLADNIALASIPVPTVTLDVLIKRAIEGRLPAFLVAEIELAQIAVSGPSRDRLVALIEALRGVTPLSRRLALLDELARCDASRPQSPGLGKLLALLPRDATMGSDPALFSLRLGHVHRVFGDPDKAASFLEAAERASLEPPRPALLRRIYRAMGQLRAAVSASDGGSEGFDHSPADRANAADEWLKAEHETLLEHLAMAPPFLKLVTLLEHGERIVRHGASPDLLAKTLAAVEPLAATVPTWDARRLALQGKLALSTGQWAEGERLLAQAAAAYETLDDPANAAALRDLIAGFPVPARAMAEPEVFAVDLPSESGVPVIRHEVKTGGRLWTVSVRGADQAAIHVEVPAPKALAEDIDTPSFTFLFDALSKDPQTAARELGVLLPMPANIQSLKEKGQVDLVLSTIPSTAGWLPLEWATFGEDRPLVADPGFRYIYRVTRPTTAAGDGREGRILLVSPEASGLAESQIRQSRSYEEMGLDLRRMYARAGLRPVVCTGLDQIQDLLREMKPTVVHFATNLGDEYGRPGLVFGARRPAMMASAYGSSRDLLDVKRLIDAFERARIDPLVILDVPTPPTLTEFAEQLYLRNLFAAEWADTVLRGAILAAGLAPRNAVEEATMELIKLLVRGEPVGSIVRHIWSRPAEQPADQLAWRSAALFTSDPGRVFPVG